MSDYFHFWPSFFSAWFAQFPERLVVFPDVEGSLTGEQEAKLGKAVEMRKTKLQTWFRWRANCSRQGRIQKKTKSVFEQAIEGKKGRILSEPELYNDLYYEERIKPLVDADRQEGRLNSKGKILGAARAHAKRLLKDESEDVKEQIHEMYLLQKEKKNDGNADGTDKRADTLQQAIDDLPTALARVAEIIKRQTGFTTSFICAGPDPSRNWQITSLSCHSDKTAAGYTFASLYPKQEEEVLKAFQEFAEQLFPPEIRKQGAAQTDDVNPPGDTELGFDTDLQSEGGLQVPDDTAVSSSGVEDGLDTDHGPDDSEFTEPEDGVERDEEDGDEVAAENEEEERNSDIEMVRTNHTSRLSVLPFNCRAAGF
ncbi:hypothetical protein EV363DRAFT_1407631 [Boletus edulis]|nr:hypothetical protein EV363DRAFT_1407631 [Boletus edulis]